ncbi:MAG: deoxyribonuclease IV [Nanoarchaeota archaeon]|nr:deoxyribonuclease IV [Nanoarchaeota archaeon]
MPNIGAHVSTAGGLWKAVENARAIGATCIQIFGASPRQWVARLPSKIEIKKFKDALGESGIHSVYLHASYLVNLASANKDIFEKSVKNLTAHLSVAEEIGAEGVIFHPGSAKGHAERKTALDQEARAMREVIKNVPGHAKLFMENTAGGGQKIGGVEDIAYLFLQVKSSRVQVCVDTAHALEEGMIDEYVPQKIKKFADAWDGAVGIKNIPVLHMNDSKTVAGSHHDRHENIGEGHIGRKGFECLAKEKRFRDKDWILEVPGFEGQGPDKKNIDILKFLG